MRLKVLKTLFPVLVAASVALGGVTPARAHAHKAAVKPEPHHAATSKQPAKPAAKQKVAAKASARTPRHVALKAAKPVTPHKKLVASTKAKPAVRATVTKAPAKAVHAARLDKSETVARHAEEPVAEAAPAPEPVALPEIHVTHNRKQHLQTPAAEESPVSELPRKATPADFLTGSPSENKPLAVERTSMGETSAAFIPTINAGTAPVVRTGPVVAPPKQVSVLAVIRKPAEKASLPVAKAPVEKELVAKVPEPPPVLLPALYTRRGKLIVPAALKGSHEILVHQNVMADHDGLDRIQDDEDLEQMRGSKLLVAIPQNAGIRVDERLAANRRYTRPWTASFLTALARAHYERFHTALQVNSAVRTVEFQQRLIRTNGNAAPAEGETASPHLTGQAVDLAKKGLSLTEIAWLRGYLLPLVQEGKVDVEEEFQQACFHISVYKKYVPQAAPPRTITAHRSAASALAAAVR